MDKIQKNDETNHTKDNESGFKTGYYSTKEEVSRSDINLSKLLRKADLNHVSLYPIPRSSH